MVLSNGIIKWYSQMVLSNGILKWYLILPWYLTLQFDQNTLKNGIIVNMPNFKGISVIGRTSSFAYK